MAEMGHMTGHRSGVCLPINECGVAICFGDKLPRSFTKPERQIPLSVTE